MSAPLVPPPCDCSELIDGSRNVMFQHPPGCWGEVRVFDPDVIVERVRIVELASMQIEERVQVVRGVCFFYGVGRLGDELRAEQVEPDRFEEAESYLSGPSQS
ncbi:MAG: hypothetical protein ABWX92_03615, partial [Mycetocola sp.]